MNIYAEKGFIMKQEITEEIDELIDNIVSRLEEMTIHELRQTDMFTESLIA